MALLSISNDPKTVKGEKYGYLTAIQYLAPSNLSGYNVCPNAKLAGCEAPCLNTAGRGAMNKIQEARIKRTKRFFEDREGYLEQLSNELNSFINRALKRNLKPAVRLNGTSDIRWENYVDMAEYPDVQFYEYTKLDNRRNLPDNYHLTWSYSEVNSKYLENAPKHLNWAVVFGDGLPHTFKGRPVIDGDKSDLRFLDPVDVVVGLKAKGKARKDKSGFVIRNYEDAEEKQT